MKLEQEAQKAFIISMSKKTKNKKNTRRNNARKKRGERKQFSQYWSESTTKWPSSP